MGGRVLMHALAALGKMALGASVKFLSIEWSD